MPDTPKHLMACVWTKSNTKAIVLSSGRKVVAPKEGKTMLETLDIVTTAKLRGIVKKLGIKYVTDSASYFPAQCDGIHIWQNGNAIYFKTFKDNDKIYLSQFVSALNELGLTVNQMLTILGEVKGSYRIVPKVGA